MSTEKDSMKLVCSHCGKKFDVGKDSIIIDDKALHEGVREMGGLLIDLSNDPSDLVMYGGDLPIDTRKKQIKRIQRLIVDIREGKKRCWRCGSCNNKQPNTYPF